MIYSYSCISDAGRSWINDLRDSAPESGFPDIDPSSMTETERDAMVTYLALDDGSLSTENMEFSIRVAKEIENLTGDEE